MQSDRRFAAAFPPASGKGGRRPASPRSRRAKDVPMRSVMGLLRLLRRNHASSSVLRVGIDLVEVDAVAASLESSLSERYLSRVYTRGEVLDCTEPGGPNAARLAARFAAKEAVLKALDVGDRAVPWQAIEVRRSESGAPSIELHG